MSTESPGSVPSEDAATSSIAVSSSSPAVRRGSARATAKRQLSRVSGLALLAIFVAVFAIWIPDTFLTTTTLRSILGGQAITIVLALGLLFTLSAGQYDLSAAQNLGLSAVVGADLIVAHGISPVPACLITLVLSVTIGAVNGVLVTVVGDSFIVTLGMSSVLLALTELISNNQFIGPLPHDVQRVTSYQPLGIPVDVIYALILAAIAWYILEHTPIGRRTYATGANADAARLSGVRTSRYVIGAFVVTSLLAGVAGLMAMSSIGEVTSTLGPPYLLPVFAACFLGTTQVKIGRFNVWGSVLTLYLLETGTEGLQLAGGQLWVTDLFNGVALIGAVTIAVVGQRRKREHG